MRVALRAVANDGDLLALNEREVGGIVVIEVCHSFPFGEVEFIYFAAEIVGSVSVDLVCAAGGRSKSRPRVMAMRPVRAISRTPKVRSTSSSPSILSTVPETSRIRDSGATSITRARNTLISSMRCGRDCWSASTLMSAKSRSIRERSEIFSARRTSTSFSRLASRRCAPFSSVCATIVMRAISSFSVGPTVSESILMAKRIVRAANHVTQRSSGSYHGINGVFLLHAEVDQYGFCGFARGPYGGHHLSALGDALAADAKSIGESCKIRRD